MKKNITILLLVISVVANLFFIGKNYWNNLYTPNETDRAILGEMTKKVFDSNEYKEISEKEKIYSIETGVDRFKGGAYPFHYGVYVKTDKKAYIFYCKDKTCSEVEQAGETYSRYMDEKPKLPLKK